MQIKVESGDITQQPTKAIIVNLLEGLSQPAGATAAVDGALDGAISRLIADGDLRGKYNDLTLVHTIGKIPAAGVLVVGLGKPEDLTLDRVRDVAANAARYLRRQRCRSAATVAHGAGVAGLEAEACAQAIAEGTLMGLYTFRRHKKRDEDETDLEELTLVEEDASKLEALQRGVELGIVLAEAANFCRDLANEPSNVLTPSEMAERARAMAHEAGLECQILERKEMEEMEMGALLGVAQGSQQPPKLIVLHYRGAPGEEGALGLVGKGITFDAGGISIKPSGGMEEMKGDMSGGAAIIAAMRAIGQLRPAINVTAIVPASENMPSGSALKPGDVLRAMNGKTIEIINTDAEGRLILADALSYARRLGLSPIVDVATLTGAISVALGNVAMGAMTNDETVLEKVKQAAAAAGEKVWQLPMYEEYKEQIKSDVADMKNTGGRNAGSITAAFLLKEFVEDTPWVHLDMAGVDNYDKEKGVMVKGASGIPVRTLVRLALALAEERGRAAPE
ncbi:MAG: leucyl aminopeptidase [Dehalococcoidia bacterium]